MRKSYTFNNTVQTLSKLSEGVRHMHHVLETAITVQVMQPRTSIFSIEKDTVVLTSLAQKQINDILHDIHQEPMTAVIENALVAYAQLGAVNMIKQHVDEYADATTYREQYAKLIMQPNKLLDAIDTALKVVYNDLTDAIAETLNRPFNTKRTPETSSSRILNALSNDGKYVANTFPFLFNSERNGLSKTFNAEYVAYQNVLEMTVPEPVRI